MKIRMTEVKEIKGSRVVPGLTWDDINLPDSNPYLAKSTAAQLRIRQNLDELYNRLEAIYRGLQK